MNQARAELAASIYHHVAAYLRDPESNKRDRLQAAFAALDLSWATWSIEPDPKPLREALEKDGSFRAELADALDWDIPAEDRRTLVQMVISAADFKWNTEKLKAAFPPDLPWDTWVRDMKQDKIQDLLDFNPTAAKAVARALGYPPEKKHAAALADKAVADLKANRHVGEIESVFRRHTLNWEQFLQGGSEAKFQDRLRDDFDFRQAVARATDYVSEEAIELAGLAVQMLGNMRPSARSTAIGKIGIHFRDQKILDAYKTDRAATDGREAFLRDLVAEIAHEFSRDPAIAAKVWNTMSWPRPFPLVLREEQRQIAWRRRTAESAELARTAVATLDALPPARPESKTDTLPHAVQRILDVLRNRNTVGHDDLLKALEEFQNAER